MDGKRLRDFWNQEVAALLAAYRQFETLLPNPSGGGAQHRGEDGRYVEALIRTYLQKYLPNDLEVLTGFVLRPAVKTGNQDRARVSEEDQHTSQIDIIVYDTAMYPVFQRMGDTVIVPPEGVVALISVKKTLRDADIDKEIAALLEASNVCRSDEKSELERRRGPFLALIAASSALADKKSAKEETIMRKLRSIYGVSSTFDNMLGFIGDLSGWHIIKSRPEKSRSKNSAKYIYIEDDKDHLHQSFQFIISGIMSVHYDVSRRNVKRPGYTAFPARPAKPLGEIPYISLR